MARRIGAAILMCAVMVLVAAVPLAMADTHLVTKGPQGPRASAVTWSYTTTDYGIWIGHIVNSGLRSLVVDVVDDSTGMAVSVLHQRIRFAAFDAYPAGEVNTTGAIMAKDRTYTITVTPNGPRGTTCTVEDIFIPAAPPVAVIDASVNLMDVAVSGANSTDPDGTIMTYAWNFGDGSTATGVTATHTYLVEGTYTITLTVTDNDGLTASASVDVNPHMQTGSPVAVMTVVPNKLTVTVNGSGSYDLDGTVVSWAWDFGDGTTATGVTATHTYATWGTWTITLTVTDNSALTGSAGQLVTVSNPTSPPPAPYNVLGYVYDPVMNPVLGASVTIKDMRTGAIWAATTDLLYGYYMVDLNTNETGWAMGDTIQVSATDGVVIGTVSGITGAPGSEAYLILDVILP